MEKIIAVLCILLALILLIPYPAKIKDGGTIHYDALIYDVYDLHALYESPDGEMRFVEGFIIKIFGIQVFNSTEPHIDSVTDQPTISA